MSIARVRVELKPSKKGPEIDFKIMFTEFKRRVSDAGILHELKERQYFESKSHKERMAKRAQIQKRKEEDMEQKILRGEKVKGSSKLVKKIRNRSKYKKGKDNRTNGDNRRNTTY